MRMFAVRVKVVLPAVIGFTQIIDAIVATARIVAIIEMAKAFKFVMHSSV